MDWTEALAELMGLNGRHLVVVVPGPGEQDIGLARCSLGDSAMPISLAMMPSIGYFT